MNYTKLAACLLLLAALLQWVESKEVQQSGLQDELTDLADASLALKKQQFEDDWAALKSDETGLAQPEQVPFKFLSWLRNTVSASVAPVKQWGNLIWRYRQWFTKYETLRTQRTNKHMKSASDKLREEYARVDRAMVEEFCSRGEEPSEELLASNAKPVDLKSMENHAYLMDVLVQVIDKLESSLKEQEPAVGLKALLVDDVLPTTPSPPLDEEQQKESIDRVKRILLKEAKNVAVNEMFAMAKTAVGFTIAQYMIALPNENMNMLISFLLGPPTQGFAERYLINSMFRVAYQTARYVGPIAYEQCKMLTPQLK